MHRLDLFSAVFFYCTCLYLFIMLFHFIWIVFFRLHRLSSSRFSCGSSKHFFFQTQTIIKHQILRSNSVFSCSDLMATPTNFRDNIIFWAVYDMAHKSERWFVSSPIDKYTKVSFVCDMNKYLKMIKIEWYISSLPECVIWM